MDFDQIKTSISLLDDKAIDELEKSIKEEKSKRYCRQIEEKIYENFPEYKDILNINVLNYAHIEKIEKSANYCHLEIECVEMNLSFQHQEQINISCTFQLSDNFYDIEVYLNINHTSIKLDECFDSDDSDDEDDYKYRVNKKSFETVIINAKCKPESIAMKEFCEFIIKMVNMIMTKNDHIRLVYK